MCGILIRIRQNDLLYRGNDKSWQAACLYQNEIEISAFLNDPHLSVTGIKAKPYYKLPWFLGCLRKSARSDC